MRTETVELVDLEPQELAVVTGRVRALDLPEFLAGVFGEVERALKEQHLGPMGPPFGRYTPTPEGFHVEAGFPASAPVLPSGRVVALALPGGTAARIRYRGDYAGIREAYADVDRWLDSHGMVTTGRPWERYLDGPDVPEPRTDLYVPCARR